MDTAAADCRWLSALPGQLFIIFRKHRKHAGTINPPFYYTTDAFMALDIQTQNNLELFPQQCRLVKDALLSVIDLTKTAMGSRLIKRRLTQPLLDLKALNQTSGCHRLVYGKRSGTRTDHCFFNQYRRP